MSHSAVSSQNLLLCVTGSIAAYKSADIIRRLQEHGADVRVVMTESAEKFIGKVTLQALSGYPVYQNMFVSDDRAMEHIDLARWADKILIAPATANTIAKLATGLADDIISTLCLAADCPVFVAPSMNHMMWENTATQENIQTLKQRGLKILAPDSGDQACGENGEGRLQETNKLVASVLASTSLLANKNVLITAGPTREAIDPVRYISNHSSGKMGYALAQQARFARANVVVVSGPSNLTQVSGIQFENVISADEMHAAVMKHIAKTDIFIAAAAVADYRPTKLNEQKIKKTDESVTIQLTRNRDILADVSHLNQDTFCVGFAAETENLEENAKLKLKEKKLDMIVANYVGKSVTGDDIGFNANLNTVSILTENNMVQLTENTKNQIAKQIIKIVAEKYEKKHSS